MRARARMVIDDTPLPRHRRQLLGPGRPPRGVRPPRRRRAGAVHRAGDVQLLGEARAHALDLVAPPQRPPRRRRPRPPDALRRPRHGAAAGARPGGRASSSAACASSACRACRSAPTSTAGTSTTPRSSRFFEAAQDLGAAVFVHPWDMLGGDRMQQYWLPWLVGMPAETRLAICSRDLRRRAGAAAALRIGFAHGGGSFPGIRPHRARLRRPARPRARSTTARAAPLPAGETAPPVLRRLAGPRRRRAPPSCPPVRRRARRARHRLPVPARRGRARRADRSLGLDPAAERAACSAAPRSSSSACRVALRRRRSA